MLQQKSKPNKGKLKLNNVEISAKSNQPNQAEQKINVALNLPIIYYYTKEIPIGDVSKIIIDNTKFIPTCYLKFTDVFNIMHDIGFPGDNSTFTVVLPPNSPVLGNIFLKFKIKKYKVNGTTNTNKKIEMFGILDVDKLYISLYKSYHMSSYDLFKNFADDSGLGFMSNVDSSSDKMPWLNPSISYFEFLKDTISKAWLNDNGFLWSFIDLFYNLNYVDVETALNDDLSKVKWVASTIFDNNNITNNPQNAVIPALLTNDKSQVGSNIFFVATDIVNQSTEISLKNGYVRNIQFYDIDGNWSEKAGSYKSYQLDTITTSGSNILMKGDIGSTDFYNAHIVNHYLDKIDTINVFTDFLWAQKQNSENIKDLQKVAMEIILPIPNYNLKRYEKVELLFINDVSGINKKTKNIKLNGEWLVIGIRFEWTGGALYQYVQVVKRELSSE